MQHKHHFHRLALAPFVHNEAHIAALWEQLEKEQETNFIQFLDAQGMGPLWHATPVCQALPLSDQSREHLHQLRLNHAALYLLQRHQLHEIRKALDNTEIPHAITKGCHTREVYYTEPNLRPAVDIDVLISPEHKLETIKALQSAGFTFHADKENIAQDCSLIKGDTAIDLHWDILRPGRTRQPITGTLLKSRQDYKTHWGLDHGATLFMMLVHPMFRKYTNGPRSSLARLVDLILLLQNNPEGQQRAIQLLHHSGLSAAGWATLIWLTYLTDFKAEMMNDIAPGKLRKSYINWWLQNDNSTRMHSTVTKVAFTLTGHDKLADILRAVRQARYHKRRSETELAVLEQALSKTTQKAAS